MEVCISSELDDVRNGIEEKHPLLEEILKTFPDFDKPPLHLECCYKFGSRVYGNYQQKSKFGIIWKHTKYLSQQEKATSLLASFQITNTYGRYHPQP